MEKQPRIGVLLVGAYGSVSTCALIGSISQGLGLCDTTGMVTGLPMFDKLNLASPATFVWGGWDIRRTTLVAGAEELYSVTRSIRREILDAVKPGLIAIEGRIRQGTSFGLSGLLERFPDAVLVEECAAAAVERLRKDIRDFVAAHSLDTVIVVNVASTEPLRVRHPAWESLKAFAAAIESDDHAALSPSMLYAYASLSEGCPFINFTPSPGTELPALRELADAKGLPHTGRDGKTGETLLKTVLAPMFVARNFRMLSWEGYNMLGNRDGLILDDPGSKSAKTANKDAVLRNIVTDPAMHTRTRIDYVPSLDDWKVAWDYVHFEGFLGTRMTFSFMWQGCDSMLAAPLVLDLIRLMAHARARGEKGVQKQLACFFKNPIDGTTMDFFQQFSELLKHYGLASR
ncbi:MAG: inositol-3-phosphate synthase [Candidatus Brocadiia bacterium]